ncbi:MAG: glycine--tRNA ligase [Chloroflexi bacterium]|nr:glycine--tRNA ligase [Chloroflexota bacterium]
MDKIVSLCKRRGFIFQSSEIYGGLGSVWDYGPLGAELKRNLKDAWWRANVYARDDVVGLDAAILMHPQTWVASGHVETFADPLVECQNCNQRFRPDQVLVSEVTDIQNNRLLGYASGFNREEVLSKSRPLLPKRMLVMFQATAPEPKPFQDYLGNTSKLPCPFCDTVGQLTDPRMFNLMLKTFLGPVEDTASLTYLRPETAQGIFVNFQNVLTTSRKKLPFGIAQTGKAFRNEITPGNFTFRTREFEQMEIEFFVRPGADDDWLTRWVNDRFHWYLSLGIRQENLRTRRHAKDELAHYAKDCYDIEYHFPWGWAELEGIANRTDFDLRRHAQFSGKDLSYYDDEAKERFYPYVIEPSGGVDRAALAFLVDAYDEEQIRSETRTLLRLHPDLAPVKAAVLPLSRNERLLPKAKEVYALLREQGARNIDYDDAQSIGRRYRRQDELGTPFCVTIDFQSLDDNAVTIRDRDSLEQLRLPIPQLPVLLAELLNHGWSAAPAHLKVTTGPPKDA